MGLPVMYIVVNNDLKMSSGKTASQVGHAVQLITEEIMRIGYESTNMEEKKHYMTYMKWRQHCTKIVLKASNDELNNLLKIDIARPIIDDGQTQVAPNSLTVVGFYPSSTIGNEYLKDFKLL